MRFAFNWSLIPVLRDCPYVQYLSALPQGYYYKEGSNKRAGVGTTKMNAGILACGLAKIHQGGGMKRLFD
ncbi:hypothetical protein DMA11_24885 [Marinilabiliaceae bacterium JC017]|nr:hypothetical protein DMA11_24885 [Marinilabiliaceae bacterium JC017]